MGDDLVKAPVTTLKKVTDWLDNLDDSIDATTRALVTQVAEDRERAELVYTDLLNLFHQGNNDPDHIRELNKAQEILQKTTAQLQKVLDTLAKIKVGETKIQIAQVQGDNTPVISRQDLLDILDGGSGEDD